jgi:Na+-transporting NADH:ubiquinone oxidoreductase subunit A
MPGSVDFETRNTTQLGLLGRDYRGVQFELLCEEGDQVRAGAEIMRDGRRPEILFRAPASGRVSRVERGARRKLLTLQIDADENPGVVEFAAPSGLDQESQRAFMLESGSWSGLHTRPFGNIPNPSAQPAAIFITALDAEPLAPPVAAIIDSFTDEFSAAVSMLARISDAPLYLCHAPGHHPPFDEASGAICEAFAGGTAASLPGRHIQALCPIGFAGAEVWHIGYQETIALGHLLLHGRPWLQRIVSLGGDAVRQPRCLLVPPGAAIAELLDGEIEDGPVRILGASAADDGKFVAECGFLSAGQRNLTVLMQLTGTALAGDMGALIPGDWLEANAPPGIHAVPLMRALQLGDVERARELGALELVEEDLAALSRVCVSRSDYGLLLRRILDQLEALR